MNQHKQSIVQSAIPTWTAVIDEHIRQAAEEGRTAEANDQHVDGELALAAAAYVLSSASDDPDDVGPTLCWPWSLELWKPGDRRRDLIRAGAFILAELERLDRLDRHERAQTNRQLGKDCR